MMKVVALGAIAKMIFPFIGIVFNGPVKKVARFFYLISYLGQVNKTERSAVFFNEILKRYPMKSEVVIPQIKAFLWEIIALLYQVKICILHFLWM
jgi:hypothetical protein